ncbi:MAG: HAD family hydrolase [Solirubrobacteraceae bacterium]
MSTRALLLDALGTLVELPPPAPALRSELSRRFGVDAGLADAERAIVAEIAFYRARFDDARDLEALRELRRQCAVVMRDALPASAALRSAGIDELVAALLGALRFRAYPDAAPALRAARERGLRIVVASNWDVALPEVLERIGLAQLVDGVVSSAMVGARKPAAAPFEAALALAGVGPSEALHVGDSVAEDVEGALAAGLSAALIVRSGDPPADVLPANVARIASLSELSALT